MDRNESARGIFACRPVLFTKDMAQSLAFYRDLLGFAVGWRWSNRAQAFLPDQDDSTPDTAVVVRDAVQLILGSQGAPGAWLHLDISSAEELDGLHKEWMNRGVSIAESPSLRPWGMYEMRVVDPDGHTLRVSAPSRKGQAS